MMKKMRNGQLLVVVGEDILVPTGAADTTRVTSYGVDASDLGLSPGYWPRHFLLDIPAGPAQWITEQMNHIGDLTDGGELTGKVYTNITRTLRATIWND